MGCVRVVVAQIVLVASVGGATDALAQATAEEAPKVQEIRAVERGGFVQTDVGLTYIVNEVDDRRYGLGYLVGVFAGYDVLPILSIGLGVTAIATGVRIDESTPSPAGDLLFVIPSARVQLAVLTTERNFVWLRADVGFGLGLPGDIDGTEYGGNGLAGAFAVGYERFTKLRHFSVGIVAGANVVTAPALGIGISIVPMMKYTF